MEIHDQALAKEVVMTRATSALPIQEEWPDSVTPQSGPVCVRGATSGWPVHDLVLSGELQRRCGDEVVSFVDPDGRTQETTVGAYFADLAAGRAHGTYLKGWHVTAHLDSLAELPLPLALRSWFDQLPDKSRPDWTWIFVGPAGSESPTHVDVMCSSAWNLLVSGTKEWTFLSPKTAASLGHLESDLAAVTGHGEDVTFTFVQHPGDVVIVPGGWAHSVRNVEDTVSLTGNWVSGSNVDLVQASLRSSGQDTWGRLVEALRVQNETSDGSQ